MTIITFDYLTIRKLCLYTHEFKKKECEEKLEESKKSLVTPPLSIHFLLLIFAFHPSNPPELQLPLPLPFTTSNKIQNIVHK